MIVNEDISDEELKVFLQETDDILQNLDEDIIKLEKEDNKDDILQRIFRAAHTLKGSSGMVGHKRMAEVTHAMENMLDKLRNKKISLNSNMVDLLLRSLDVLKVLRMEINQQEESDIDISPVVSKIRHELSQQNIENVTNSRIADSGSDLKLDIDALDQLRDANKAGLTPLKIKIVFTESSIWKAVRCIQILNELQAAGRIIHSSPSTKEIEEENVKESILILFCTNNGVYQVRKAIEKIDDIEHIDIIPYNTGQLVAPEELTSMPNPTKQALNEDPNPDNSLDKKISEVSGIDKPEVLQSVRVDVKLLDKLMNMVEELVIDRSRISQVGKGLELKYQSDVLVGDLQETSNHIVKVVNELYQDIMKVRMLPISIVFNKFPRLVRDLAHKQRKDINFTIQGEATELDRNIIEQIRDPLVHLLRNAVDHGVEPPEEREATGKSQKAEIILSAYQEEGHILITLKDDGKGIDLEKVKSSAIKKGLISSESAKNMSQEEILDLIFSPGISTAEKITEISGRGVGLDIVRNNIEKINGTVHLSTQISKGTTFTIKLPLTVAVFRGLMVSINETIFIIPMTSVVETKKVQPGDINTILGEGVMRLREHIIPIMYVEKILTREISSNDNYENKYIVVVKSGDRSAGIIVEHLLEQQEFVIKPLGNYLGELKGIAGASILGNGQTSLILDIPTLIRMIKHQNSDNLNKIPLLI
jgi:two-component system chemotaxis sensor kinase CheA